MSYINKKERVFLDHRPKKNCRKRSEGRLKEYSSELDLRSWCDEPEDRRQHILELIYRQFDCKDKLIPLGLLIDTLISSRNAEICRKLKKYLKMLWEFIDSLRLSDKEKDALALLKQAMDEICKDKKSTTAGEPSDKKKKRRPSRRDGKEKGKEGKKKKDSKGVKKRSSVGGGGSSRKGIGTSADRIGTYKKKEDGKKGRTDGSKTKEGDRKKEVKSEQGRFATKKSGPGVEQSKINAQSPGKKYGEPRIEKRNITPTGGAATVTRRKDDTTKNENIDQRLLKQKIDQQPIVKDYGKKDVKKTTEGIRGKSEEGREEIGKDKGKEDDKIKRSDATGGRSEERRKETDKNAETKRSPVDKAGDVSRAADRPIAKDTGKDSDAKSGPETIERQASVRKYSDVVAQRSGETQTQSSVKLEGDALRVQKPASEKVLGKSEERDHEKKIGGGIQGRPTAEKTGETVKDAEKGGDSMIEGKEVQEEIVVKKEIGTLGRRKPAGGISKDEGMMKKSEEAGKKSPVEQPKEILLVGKKSTSKDTAKESDTKRKFEGVQGQPLAKKEVDKLRDEKLTSEVIKDKEKGDDKKKIEGSSPAEKTDTTLSVGKKPGEDDKKKRGDGVLQTGKKLMDGEEDRDSKKVGEGVRGQSAIKKEGDILPDQKLASGTGSGKAEEKEVEKMKKGGGARDQSLREEISKDKRKIDDKSKIGPDKGHTEKEVAGDESLREGISKDSRKVDDKSKIGQDKGQTEKEVAEHEPLREGISKDKRKVDDKSKIGQDKGQTETEVAGHEPLREGISEDKRKVDDKSKIGQGKGHTEKEVAGHEPLREGISKYESKVDDKSKIGQDKGQTKKEVAGHEPLREGISKDKRKVDDKSKIGQGKGHTEKEVAGHEPLREGISKDKRMVDDKSKIGQDKGQTEKEVAGDEFAREGISKDKRKVDDKSKIGQDKGQTEKEVAGHEPLREGISKDKRKVVDKRKIGQDKGQTEQEVAGHEPLREGISKDKRKVDDKSKIGQDKAQTEKEVAGDESLREGISKDKRMVDDKSKIGQDKGQTEKEVAGDEFAREGISKDKRKVDDKSKIGQDKGQTEKEVAGHEPLREGISKDKRKVDDKSKIGQDKGQAEKEVAGHEPLREGISKDKRKVDDKSKIGQDKAQTEKEVAGDESLREGISKDKRMVDDKSKIGQDKGQTEKEVAGDEFAREGISKDKRKVDDKSKIGQDKGQTEKEDAAFRAHQKQSAAPSDKTEKGEKKKMEEGAGPTDYTLQTGQKETVKKDGISTMVIPKDQTGKREKEEDKKKIKSEGMEKLPSDKFDKEVDESASKGIKGITTMSPTDKSGEKLAKQELSADRMDKDAIKEGLKEDIKHGPATKAEDGSLKVGLTPSAIPTDRTAESERKKDDKKKAREKLSKLSSIEKVGGVLAATPTDGEKKVDEGIARKKREALFAEQETVPISTDQQGKDKLKESDQRGIITPKEGVEESKKEKDRKRITTIPDQKIEPIAKGETPGEVSDTTGKLKEQEAIAADQIEQPFEKVTTKKGILEKLYKPGEREAKGERKKERETAASDKQLLKDKEIIEKGSDILPKKIKSHEGPLEKGEVTEEVQSKEEKEEMEKDKDRLKPSVTPAEQIVKLSDDTREKDKEEEKDYKSHKEEAEKLEEPVSEYIIRKDKKQQPEKMLKDKGIEEKEKKKVQVEKDIAHIEPTEKLEAKKSASVTTPEARIVDTGKDQRIDKKDEEKIEDKYPAKVPEKTEGRKDKDIEIDKFVTEKTEEDKEALRKDVDKVTAQDSKKIGKGGKLGKDIMQKVKDAKTFLDKKRKRKKISTGEEGEKEGGEGEEAEEEDVDIEIVQEEEAKEKEAEKVILKSEEQGVDEIQKEAEDIDRFLKEEDKGKVTDGKRGKPIGEGMLPEKSDKEIVEGRVPPELVKLQDEIELEDEQYKQRKGYEKISEDITELEEKEEEILRPGYAIGKAQDTRTAKVETDILKKEKQKLAKEEEKRTVGEEVSPLIDTSAPIEEMIEKKIVQEAFAKPILTRPKSIEIGITESELNITELIEQDIRRTKLAEPDDKKPELTEEQLVEKKKERERKERKLKEPFEEAKHRCAAIIRQIKERCAANAAASGGIVTLPDKQQPSQENLIPKGYLPGKVLPSVVFPRPISAVPDWIKISEQQRKICKGVCAKSKKDGKIQRDGEETEMDDQLKVSSEPEIEKKTFIPVGATVMRKAEETLDTTVLPSQPPETKLKQGMKPGTSAEKRIESIETKKEDRTFVSIIDKDEEIYQMIEDNILVDTEQETKISDQKVVFDSEAEEPVTSQQLKLPLADSSGITATEVPETKKECTAPCARKITGQQVKFEHGMKLGQSAEERIESIETKKEDRTFMAIIDKGDEEIYQIKKEDILVDTEQETKISEQAVTFDSEAEEPVTSQQMELPPGEIERKAFIPVGASLKRKAEETEMDDQLKVNSEPEIVKKTFIPVGATVMKKAEETLDTTVFPSQLPGTKLKQGMKPGTSAEKRIESIESKKEDRTFVSIIDKDEEIYQMIEDNILMDTEQETKISEQKVVFDSAAEEPVTYQQVELPLADSSGITATELPETKKECTAPCARKITGQQVKLEQGMKPGKFTEERIESIETKQEDRTFVAITDKEDEEIYQIKKEDILVDTEQETKISEQAVTFDSEAEESVASQQMELPPAYLSGITEASMIESVTVKQRDEDDNEVIKEKLAQEQTMESVTVQDPSADLREIIDEKIDESRIDRENLVKQDEDQTIEDNMITTEKLVPYPVALEKPAILKPLEVSISHISDVIRDDEEEIETKKEFTEKQDDKDEHQIIDDKPKTFEEVTEADLAPSRVSILSEHSEEIPAPPLLLLVEGTQIDSDLLLQGEQKLNMSLTDEEEITRPTRADEETATTLVKELPKLVEKGTEPIIKKETEPTKTLDNITVPRAVTLKDSKEEITQPVPKEESIIMHISDITTQLVEQAFVPRAASIEAEIENEAPSSAESRQITATPEMKDEICGTDVLPVKNVCTAPCSTNIPIQPVVEQRWYPPPQFITPAPTVISQTLPLPLNATTVATTSASVADKGTWVCKCKCTVITKSGENDETIIFTDPHQPSTDIIERIQLGSGRTPAVICKAVCVDENQFADTAVTSTAVTARPHVEEKSTWICSGKCTIITKDGGKNETVVIADQINANIFENIHIGRQKESDKKETGTTTRPCQASTSKATSVPGESKPCTDVCAIKKRSEGENRKICTCVCAGEKRVCKSGRKICTAVCTNTGNELCAANLSAAKKSEGKKVCCCNANREMVMTVKNISTKTEKVHQCAAGKICDPLTKPRICLCQCRSAQKDQKEKSTATPTPDVDPSDDLPSLIIHKDAENFALKKALTAKEAYCAEQRKIAAAAIEQLENIKNIVEERDDLRKKLENSQNELDDLKRSIALGKPFVCASDRKGSQYAQIDSNVYIPFTGSKPTEPNSCEEEILALEKEIEVMRNEKLTPDLEAQVIRKEVEVLKKYCAKLSTIQAENNQLREDLVKYEELSNVLGLKGDKEIQFDIVKEKLAVLQETEKERDILKSRVEKLERELYAYNDLPEDIEVFKQRSLLLDEVLQDRDRLSKRVEQLRGIDEEVIALRKKSARVDALEDKLKAALKEKNIAEDELEIMRFKSTSSEIEALNQKAESDTLRSKLVCMEQEVESLKCVCKEKERLMSERDHLQRNVDELLRMQGDYEHMSMQMKCLDVLKSEKEMYKSKYENLLGLDCECDILRAQVEKAKTIEKERDALESQVEDLECCIAEQEDEIRRLVSHIDTLAKGRDNQQEKLKEVLSSMRAELERKDGVIRSSEEKLAFVQDKLRNSIEGLSVETTNLRNRNDKLEQSMQHLKQINETLRCDLRQKESIINLLSNAAPPDINQTQKISDELTLSIKGINAEVTKLVDHNEKLEQEICRRQEKIEYLQYELEKKDSEINILQDVLQDRETVFSDTYQSAIRNVEKITCPNPDCEMADLLIENSRLQNEIHRYNTENAVLQSKLKEKDNEIRFFQQALNDHELNQEEEKKQQSSKDYAVNLMRNQLDAANKENKRLQQTVTRMDSVGGDEHLRQMLRQSKCAIERIALELSKQYEEWDCIKEKLKKQRADNANIATKEEKVTETDKIAAEMGTDDYNAWDCRKNIATKEEKVTETDKIAAEMGTDDYNAWDCRKKLVENYTQRDSKSNLVEDWTQWDCKKVGISTEDYNQWECRKGRLEPVEEEIMTKIAPLEEELSQANDTIMALQERLSMTERISAENSALRRHSAEVQEVAKNQIEELVDHLKKCKEKLSKFEEENTNLKNKLSEMETEHAKYNKMLSELESLKLEKEGMEKMLTSNVVTSGRRSSKLENDLQILTDENKRLKEEIEQLTQHKMTLEVENKALTDENKRLLNELEQLKSTQGDSSIIDALKKENEELKREVENQKREINELLDNFNRSLPEVEITQEGKDLKEKEALQAIIDDLEHQLNNMVTVCRRAKPLTQDNLQKIIDELAKRLEDEQKRADAAEEALRKLKISDPSQMLNDEIEKLKRRITELEDENNKLKEMALREKLQEITPQARVEEVMPLEKREDTPPRKTPSVEEKIEEPLPPEIRVKRDVLSDEHITDKLPEYQPAQGDSALRDENDELRRRLEDFEKNKGALQKELEQMANEMKKAFDKISDLQDKNGLLNQNLVKMENENSKLKKELEAALSEANKWQEKVAQLEKENDKYKQDIKNLEEEIARLKKELDNILSVAKKGSSGISDLQDEITKLKQKLAQVEAENEKLKKELGDAKGDLSAVNQLKLENEKLKQANSDLEKELANLRKELESAKKGGDDLASLKDKLAQLEAENAKLKKEVDELKQNLNQKDNENDKLKKELEKASQEAKKGIDPLEINKLKDIISKLEDENAQLKKDLNKALDDLKQATNKIAQLQGDDSKLKQKLTTLENENEKLKKDLEQALEQAKKAASLRDDEAQLKQRVAQLETENAKLKKDLDDALLNLKQLKDENNKLQQKLTQAENENQKLKADTSKTKDDESKGNQRIAQLETENADLKKKLDDALAKILQLTDEINKIQQKLSQLENENSKLKTDASKTKDNEDKLKNTIEDLLNENAKLKKDLSNARGEHEHCGKTLSQLQDEIAKLKQKLADLEKENVNLKKNFDGAMGDFNRSGAEIEKLKQQIAQLNKEITALNAELTKAKSTIAEMKDNEAKLKQTIAQLQDENTKLKNNIDAQGKRLSKEDEDKLREKLSQMENDNKKLNNDLNKAIDEAGKLKQKIAQLEAENTKLKKELEKALADAQSNNATASQLRDENNKLKQKISQLEGEIAKLKKDLDSALEDVKRSAEMQAADTKLKQLMDKLERENAKLKEDLAAALKDAGEAAKLRDENAKQKQKISQLENEIAMLKKDLEAEIKKDLESKVKQLLAELAKQKKDYEDALAKQKKEYEDVLAKQKKEYEDALAKLKKEHENDLAKQKKENEDALAKLKKEYENALAKQKKDYEDALAKQKKEHDDDLAKIKKDQEDMLKNKKEQDEALAKLKKEKDDALAKQKKEHDDALAKLTKKYEDVIAKLKKENEDALAKQKKEFEDIIAKLRKEYEEALAALKKEKEDALAILKKEKEDALAKLKKEKEDALAKQKKENDDALTKLKILEDALAKQQKEFDDMLTKLKKEKEDALAKQKKDHDDALAKLKKEFDDALAKQMKEKEDALLKQKKEHDDVVAKLKKQHEDALAKLKKEYEDIIAKLKKDQENALAKQKKDYDDAIAKLKKEHEDALAKQKKEFDDALAKLKKDQEDTLAKQKKEYEDALAKLKKEQADALAKQKKDHDDALAKLKKEHEDALTKQKKQFDDALAKASGDKDSKDLEARIKQLQAELAKQKKDFENALAKQKKECDDTINKLKEGYEKNMKEALKKNEESIAKLQKPQADFVEKVTDKDDSKDLEARIKQLQAELAKQKKECEDAIAKLKQQFEKDMMNALKKQEDSVVKEEKPDKSSKDLEAKIRQLEAELAKQKKDCDDTISKLRDQYEKNMKDALKKNEESIVKLQKPPEDFIKKISDNKMDSQDLEAQIKQLQMELAKQKKDCEDTIAKLKSQFDKDMQDALKKEREMIQKQLPPQADLIKEQEDLLKQLDQQPPRPEISDPDEKIKWLEEELARQKKVCEDLIAKLKEQFDRDMRNLYQKNADSIAELQKAHEDYIRELNERHDNELKRLQEALRKAQAGAGERDKMKHLLDDQRKKSLEIKDKVEQVESVITRERRKSRELKGTVDKLEKENAEMRRKSIQLEKEKIDLEKENTEIKRKSIQLERDRSDSVGKKPLNKLTMATFEGITVPPYFPEVIAISTPLSEEELKRLRRQNAAAAAKEQEKIEESKRPQLLRRSVGFEDNLLRKQREAHQKVLAMQYAVQLEKERLGDLRKTLTSQQPHERPERPNKQCPMQCKFLDAEREKAKQTKKRTTDDVEKMKSLVQPRKRSPSPGYVPVRDSSSILKGRVSPFYTDLSSGSSKVAKVHSKCQPCQPYKRSISTSSSSVDFDRKK